MSSTPDAEIDHQQEADDAPLRIRYRVRFAKTDLLRWISHRDLARLWERLVRRAALKLSMTEGFHPKPRIAFPSALALGVEGHDEVVELELAEVLAPHELLQRLQADDQPGLTIKSVVRLPEGFGKAQLKRSDYLITVPDDVDPSDIQPAIDHLLQQQQVSVERKKKTLTVAVADQIASLHQENGTLRLSLHASDAASLRPGDVLDLLGFGDWIERGSLIARTRVVLQRDLETGDPAVMAVAQTEHSKHTESTQ